MYLFIASTAFNNTSDYYLIYIIYTYITIYCISASNESSADYQND